MTIPLSKRPYDIFFLIYFITHIPITLVIDAQALIPSHYYRQSLVDLKYVHIHTFGDELMNTPPLWFKTGIALELLFQVPYFVYATYCFVVCNESIKLPTIIYCSHVITTVLMIIPELSVRCSNAAMHDLLIVLYSIYLVIPAALLYRVYTNDKIFHDNNTKHKFN